MADAARRSWSPPWADSPGGRDGPLGRPSRRGPRPGWSQRRTRPGSPRPGWHSRGPYYGWPGGAVLAAILFHLLGSRSEAAEGLVFRPFDLITVVILLIGPVALFWRRRYPIAVLAVAGAASIAFGTFAAPRWTFAVAPVIALFTVARAGRRRAAVVAAGAGYLAYVLICGVFGARLGVPAGARPDLRIALLLAGGLVLTIVLGGAAKVRAEHMAEMIKARAERARAREEQERRQASEERLRIAQELHDVLGHHLSLINVQAGVGLHLMDNHPEQAREALSAIKTASAEALREVRAVLGVLRPEEEAAPRQPALGLDRIGELTAGSGLPVTVTTAGERRALPAEVDRAAYRIVQEALTNVRKHAVPGSAVSVAIEYAPSAVRVCVRNEGGEGLGDGGGSGIAGMRARAESLGGTLDAGPLPGGGFRVVAVLPAPAAAAPPPPVAEAPPPPAPAAVRSAEENA